MYTIRVDGVIYSSIHEAYNRIKPDVELSTIYIRMRKGMTFDEAIRPVNLSYKAVKDHEGREFKTVKDMALFWGVPVQRTQRRLQQGWSVRHALLCDKYQTRLK